MTSIKCGKCENTHESVGEVRRCYGALPTADVVTEDSYSGDIAVVPASGANFFLTTTAQTLYDHDQEEQASRAGESRDGSGKTYLDCPYDEKDEAKALGARWDTDRKQWYVPAGVGLAAFARWRGEKSSKDSGDAETKTSSRITEDGMYKIVEEIFKVQWNLAGTNLYAKQLLADENGKWGFEYRSDAMKKLRPEHKMTLEQAKEFGALYGTCCNCGRTLTNEESIARGIGPICAENGGWA